METKEAGRGLADCLLRAHLPVCPQLRPAGTQGFHPVEGYCVLDQAHKWFMIPSSEEFHNHCTSRQYSQCPWFHGDAEGGRMGHLRPECRAGRILWLPLGPSVSRGEG